MAVSVIAEIVIALTSRAKNGVIVELSLIPGKGRSAPIVKVDDQAVGQGHFAGRWIHPVPGDVVAVVNRQIRAAGVVLQAVESFVDAQQKSIFHAERIPIDLEGS